MWIFIQCTKEKLESMKWRVLTLQMVQSPDNEKKNKPIKSFQS